MHTIESFGIVPFKNENGIWKVLRFGPSRLVSVMEKDRVAEDLLLAALEESLNAMSVERLAEPANKWMLKGLE